VTVSINAQANKASGKRKMVSADNEKFISTSNDIFSFSFPSSVAGASCTAYVVLSVGVKSVIIYTM